MAHDDLPSPAERAVQDAVRALPHERADDAFRARLRHEFTSGRVGRRRESVPERSSLLRPAVLIPLVVAVLAVVVQVANRGPDWRVIAASGEGRVFVGAREFAPSETAAMARALRRGGRVRVEGALTLDLAAPGVAAVAIGPNADLTLSAAPNRGWGRSMHARLASGDVYFTTGRAFRGAVLDVATPEASVRAIGTAFAVLRQDFGTCVCVMEGHVHVGAAGSPVSEAADVPKGMRRVVGTDGKTETLPILEDSVHRLHAQHASAGRIIER